MAVRQRPQARCSFINPGPLCSPLRHAGTQSHTVHIDFCLLLLFFFFFPPVLIFMPHLFTPAPLQQRGALPALCLILRHLCLSRCNRVLAGTWRDHIAERCGDKVEPLLVENIRRSALMLSTRSFIISPLTPLLFFLS